MHAFHPVLTGHLLLQPPAYKGDCIDSFLLLLYTCTQQVSNGKATSTNQRSSSNIYELESSISKVAFESSVSPDTEESKIPDDTTPDSRFTFNITMNTKRSKAPDVTTPDSRLTFNITMKYPQGNSGELKSKFVEYIVVLFNAWR